MRKAIKLPVQKPQYSEGNIRLGYSLKRGKWLAARATLVKTLNFWLNWKLWHGAWVFS